MVSYTILKIWNFPSICLFDFIDDDDDDDGDKPLKIYCASVIGGERNLRIDWTFTVFNGPFQASFSF